MLSAIVQMIFILVLCIVLQLDLTVSCPLQSVNIHSGCYCGIEIDGTNYIHCHPYSIDTIPKFIRSYVHEKLNLSNNWIRQLTDRSFEQLKVKQIHIEGNPIESIGNNAFNPNLLNYLEELSLESSTDLSIEFFCYGHWNKLRVLKLIGFQLNDYEHCLEKLVRLERIKFEKCSIERFSSFLFNFPFLVEFSLIDSQIDSFDFDANLSNKSSSIRRLNLTGNQLENLPHDLAIRLPNLTELDLSHNLFKVVPEFNQWTNLNINLSFNMISYLHVRSNVRSIDLASNPICTIERTDELLKFTIENLDDLHCDCRLAFLFDINSTKSNEPIGVRQPLTNSSRCRTPSLFNGRYVKELTYEQLVETCSSHLPQHCRELKNFHEIFTRWNEKRNKQQNIPTSTAVEINQYSSSYHLTLFETIYENNDLIVLWSFDQTTLINEPNKVLFQILIEQETSSGLEVIRRTDWISPFRHRMKINHLAPKKNYHVCLLLTRSSYGTDKYCRETLESVNQTRTGISLINRSIVCGFLVGTVMTSVVLVSVAFVCRFFVQHCRTRSKKCSYTERSNGQRYMYIDRNDDDGTYSHSIVSFSSAPVTTSWKSNPRGPFSMPMASWHPLTAKSCCCRHPTPSTSLSETRPIGSLSSDYGRHQIDNEPMTSTSFISSTSDRMKHVYEELNDNSILDH